MTRRLGRYHLVEPIGGGPTGEVHRARVYGVAGFERQFAVKRFHPELVANPAIATKLSAAARAYGGLEHPRIARLFEYGVAGGETFTACELVPGLDLAQLLAQANQPLPPGAAFALIASAARAVGFAHGRGLAHLGLAPTNLIATPDGDVKVTDVGILAPRLPSRPSDDPALLWRLAYLAPEQLIGESTSAATDVFAFGVIAFELVTGQRAFSGATALDIEQAILSAQPREPALPKPLLRVLQRCWARSPFERFPDARALADAIDAALRLAPVEGGKREVAALVREALDRIDAVREQQLSGALSLPMPAPPAGPGRRAPTGSTDRVVSTQPEATRASQPIARIPAGPSGSPPPTPIAPPRVVVPAPRASEPSLGPGADVPVPPRPMPRGSKPSRPPGPMVAPTSDTTDEVTIARSPLDQALSALGQDDPATPRAGVLASASAPPVPTPNVIRRGDAGAGASAGAGAGAAGVEPLPLASVVSRAPGAAGPVPSTRLTTEGMDSAPTIVRDPLDALPAAAVSDHDRVTGSMPVTELSRSLTFSEALEPEIVVERAGSEGELVAPARAESQADGEPVAVAEPLTAALPPPSQVATRPEPPLRHTPSALGQVEPPAAAPPAAVAARRGRAGWAVLGVALAAGAAVAGVFAYRQWVAPSSAATGDHGATRPPAVATGGQDAGLAPELATTAAVRGAHGGRGTVAGSDHDAAHGSGSSVTPPPSGSDTAAGESPDDVPTPRAGSGSGSGPGTAGAPTPPTPPTTPTTATAPPHAAGSAAPPPEHPDDHGVADGVMSVASTPADAAVFLDGADQGKTPVTIPTAHDKHTLAVVKPGFDLFLKDVDGRGQVEAKLAEVTPSGGPAGIKVKCSHKDRYYVFVDGKPTGQLCPTERINVALGAHTVEVYDLVSEARTQYPVVVKDTEHSLRVKVD